MVQVLQYFSRFQDVKGRVGRMPALGRLVLLLAALPGLLLLALSAVLFAASLLALFLLAAPVYRLVTAFRGSPPNAREVFVGEEIADWAAPDGAVEPTPPGPRRKVEVRIVEP
jgi:hypothetical protein